MALVEHRIEDNVAVITLNSGENRFNPEFLQAFLSALDEVESNPNTRALVVTSAHEKIFCNGIDLEWLGPAMKKDGPDVGKAFFYRLNQLFKRTLISPLITFAAMNGHAFAGGAIWACAFDFRLMRSDRGYFCFPEVDLGIPFLPGMLALLKKSIPMYKLVEMHHTGARLTAQECERCNIISKACSLDELLPATIGVAKMLNKNRNTVLEMKKRLFKEILHALDVEDVPYIEGARFSGLS